MKFRALKYLLAFVLPLFVAVSFITQGWITFIPVLYAFGLIPLLELFFKPNDKNLQLATEVLVVKDKLYDALLFLAVPVQFGFLIWFLFSVQNLPFYSLTFLGRSVSMGLMCGILGINVAHELGHRKERIAQLAAKSLLFTTLYQHFFIEHNYGHHKNVSTPSDPASSRLNEPLYMFWIRSIVYSYISAWQIQIDILQRSKQSFLSIKNEMLYYALLSLGAVYTVFYLVGAMALAGFLIAAVVGILLLETVNYIEHYGLSRKKVSDKRYEQTNPMHSWNSNHVVGRMVLFELSRHSDHHANPHKHYQVLKAHQKSPQMPTGYPGMMLLSALPPVWFSIMNKRIAALDA